MHSRGWRPRHLLVVRALLLILAISPLARADAIEPNAPRRPISREAISSPVRRTVSNGGWWMGVVGITTALAVCGWVSIASRKFLPKALANAPNLRVVGRTSLSPKHSVYLLDVGGRVLLVGTGPQGAPSLLGELDGMDLPIASEPPSRLHVRKGDDQ